MLQLSTKPFEHLLFWTCWKTAYTPLYLNQNAYAKDKKKSNFACGASSGNAAAKYKVAAIEKLTVYIYIYIYVCLYIYTYSYLYVW